jgi:hypothetical protein
VSRPGSGGPRSRLPTVMVIVKYTLHSRVKDMLEAKSASL